MIEVKMMAKTLKQGGDSKDAYKPAYPNSPSMYANDTSPDGEKARSWLAQKGRKGDTKLAHLTPGEIVIPRPFTEDKEFITFITLLFQESGTDIQRYIVGNNKNKTNPETGYLEFGVFPRTPEEEEKRQRGKSLKRIYHTKGIFGALAFGTVEHAQSGSKLGFGQWMNKKIDDELRSTFGPSPSPTPVSLDAKALGKSQARQRVKNRRRGIQGTILTGGGLGSSGKPSSRSTLLG